MTNCLVEIGESAPGNSPSSKGALHRFIIFVAGGTRPVISFENFTRAERLAIIFAGLSNARMEVFDSRKEICYFVEPSEEKRLFVH